MSDQTALTISKKIKLLLIRLQMFLERCVDSSADTDELDKERSDITLILTGIIKDLPANDQQRKLLTAKLQSISDQCDSSNSRITQEKKRHDWLLLLIELLLLLHITISKSVTNDAHWSVPISDLESLLNGLLTRYGVLGGSLNSKASRALQQQLLAELNQHLSATNLFELSFPDQIQVLIQELQAFLDKENSAGTKTAIQDTARAIVAQMIAALIVELRAQAAKMTTNGDDVVDLVKNFNALISKYGLIAEGKDSKVGNAWRARLVAETNLRAAYAAGRWKQQLIEAGQRPFLLYRHSDFVRYPRPVHVKWNFMILPVTHPWWLTHYPPGGFGCQCQVYSLSQQDMLSRGLTVTPDYLIYPGDADPGFGRP